MDSLSRMMLMASRSPGTWTYIGKTSLYVTAANQAFTFPQTSQAGDLIVIQIMKHQTTSQSASTPAGFTRIAPASADAWSSYRVTGAGETSVTLFADGEVTVMQFRATGGAPTLSTISETNGASLSLTDSPSLVLASAATRDTVTYSWSKTLPSGYATANETTFGNGTTVNYVVMSGSLTGSMSLSPSGGTATYRLFAAFHLA